MRQRELARLRPSVKPLVTMLVLAFTLGIAVGAWAMNTWGMTEYVFVETISMLQPPQIALR